MYPSYQELPPVSRMRYTTVMKWFRLALAAVLVPAIVALIYYVFEGAVRLGIHYMWEEWFPTDEYRLLIYPIILVLSLIYFACLHYLDPRHEDDDEEGLGHMPKPTLINAGKTLFIGFFSLVAGASLGPEAILVPATMIIGTIFSRRLVKKGTGEWGKLLGGSAIIALFTAFFHSFFIGLLTILLVMKQTGAKLSVPLVTLSVVSAGVAYGILHALPSHQFIVLPEGSWQISPAVVVAIALLGAAGYFSTYALSFTHTIFEKIHALPPMQWWVSRAILASTVLATIYLFGGPLVQFTGNEAITPLFAAGLGLSGLLWLILIKIIAISWSKASGFRGGVIFPVIFIAAGFTAIAQLYVPEFHPVYGLTAVLIGAFIANQKTRILV